MNANSMNPEEPGTPGTAGTSGSGAAIGASTGAAGSASGATGSGATGSASGATGSASGATASGAAGSGPANGSYPQAGNAPSTSQENFFDWIRNQGVRRGPDRWIGGVASGIAHRFGIDPLIVRGIFIVLALFAGVGVLLYGIAWALLPEPDGRIHVQEAAAGRWSGGMTGALITTIIGLPGLGRGFWGWGWDGLPGVFWTLFWMGGVFYLIYFLVQRNKASKGNPPVNRQNYPSASGAPTAYGTPTTYETPTTYGAAATTNTGVPVYGTGHPGTKPQGYGAVPPAGPFTPSGPSLPSGPRPPQGPASPQDWQPKPAVPKRKGPGAAIVAVSAGAALLAGGTLKALDAGNVIELGNSANAVVWATGAAVLGLGILVAGLRGRTSGFLGFLAVVALIIGGIFNVVPRDGDRFTFHDVNWTPTSLDQARLGINVTGAQGQLDLSEMALTPPLISEVTIPVDATASNVTVIIPDDVPVEVRTDMTFGNLNERGSDRGGRLQDDRAVYNTEKPGANLVVEIDGTFSNVTIQEGN
ncbi:phage shock protein PspC (stress-responsive transcriptional regulator) [Paenarthrobacter nitroguajacolicus]|uniref:PspC domain-containing protein n=1 Tax=Paenarthrobacter nitroguajacolicus TaxID=211146 RepID=UPI00285B0189|nr:PspC domain-containing protein [Paenarthrobacter nitroguajacolicus]MDR6987774.1 phage shock protein PspC (stress-responsive transcriptional regulator) [Paenarthrobacter nitroguajacolicus]